MTEDLYEKNYMITMGTLLVSLSWRIKGQLLCQLCKSRVEVRLGRVELGRDSANYTDCECMFRLRRCLWNLLVVRRKGDREQTKEGVWKSRSSKLQCI